ncbi:MAG TPA: mechanosensitive ion channel family protein [Acidimicrobiales bacterium]|nr:mechanosensitive ion channel family protein [Acidimicrobiales bacterium]
MAQTLWKCVRRVAGKDPDWPRREPGYRPKFRHTAIESALAIAALAFVAGFGNVHGHSTQHKIVALAGTVAFVVTAVLALRSLAGEIGKATRSRGGRSAGSAVELTISVAGYILILILTLDLLGVSVQHLLLGGAIVGVVLGIALQQTLANVFAGVVLLMAHPFSIGDRIRIKSGALGGELVGLVAKVTLTYVILELDDGPLNVPNAGVLAAAVGRVPIPSAEEGGG